MLRGWNSVLNPGKRWKSRVKVPMTVYVIRCREDTTLNASLHVMTAEKPSGSPEDSRAGLWRLCPQYIILFKHQIQGVRADLPLQVSIDLNVMMIHNPTSAEVDFCLVLRKLTGQN